MGRDKARVEWAGVPMAERVARALAECVDTVRLVMRPGEKPPLELPTIEDAHPARAPMVGIAAALRACEKSAVLVAACDLPEIDPRLLDALLERLPESGGPEIVAPEGPRGPEPLLAIYRPVLLQRIEKHIRTNDLSLQKLLRDADTLLVRTATLREIDPQLRSLRNVNTPDLLR
jgi:molybdopterin-guanine dinucleotide biosynthesis protein A